MRYVLVALLVSTACVPPQTAPAPRPLDITPDPVEYAAYQGGDATLLGQAFLTTRGGDVKLAAGRTVTLDPATTFAREWFRRFGADVARFDQMPPDSLFRAARRTTVANAEGRFRFDRLAPGEYIVRSTVTWETMNSYGAPEGGVVASIVKVEEGRSAELVLNDHITPNTTAVLGVRFAQSEELTARRHEVIARASGTSCQSGIFDAAPTELQAREQLILDAANKGADVVANVVCGPQGMSWKGNCSARVVCEGDAIRWL